MKLELSKVEVSLDSDRFGMKMAAKFFVLLAQLFYYRLTRLKLDLVFLALRLHYRFQLFRANLLIRKLTFNCAKRKKMLEKVKWVHGPVK